MADALRVLDFGSVSPLRSQTLWHAVAEGVSAGAPPTLAFERPSAPYVSIGYHTSIRQLDLSACRRRQLPVYRRMAGGGPVYLDDGQLFFQICVPAAGLPPRRDDALRLLLAPAVEAFQGAGVAARLDEHGEIVVGDRKICGHGAAQIGMAVVVVGNLIERFDHAAATRVLACPSADARALVSRLVRRYVAATSCDPARFRRAAERAYADALGLRSAAGRLDRAERAALTELDRRFEAAAWVSGTGGPKRPTWMVKIRAGVWAVQAEHDGARVVAALVDGELREVRLIDPGLNGSTAAAERTLDGVRPEEAGRVLCPFGEPGRRVAAALAQVEGRQP